MLVKCLTPARKRGRLSDVKIESVITLIEKGLSDEPGRRHGDDDLNPGWANPKDPVPAAVLLPLIERAGTANLLLIRRSGHLKSHAGQIGLPGGRIEQGEGAQEAAIREAEEEVGIEPTQVRIAGRLEPYLTRTGYLIDPFVARIEQPYDFVANPAEVDAMFELPLSLVMAPDAFQTEAVTVQGKRRSFYSMRYEDHYIWGATAGILVNFRRRLEDQCAS